MNKRACILLACILSGVAPAFAADAPGGGVAWDALEPSVQELLAGQKDRWDALPPERQQFMTDGAAALAVDERDRSCRRARALQHLAQASARGARAHARALEAVPRAHARATGSAARGLPQVPGTAARAARDAARPLASDVGRGTTPRDPASTGLEARHRSTSGPARLAEDSHPARARGRIFPRCRMPRSSAPMTG